MKIIWTQKGLSDLGRLHEFLEPVNPLAAARVIQSLTQASGRLLHHPRLGERLGRYHTREVRRIIIGQYELRYEIQQTDIYILRLWHTREQR